MKPIPGTLAGDVAPFLSTQWSVVLRSFESQASDMSSHEALAQLCQAYWPPLYSFVRRRGYSSADAQDLVQGFFASLLEHRSHAQVDPSKGKFRTFLLASLKHFLSDAWDRERTLKRGGDKQTLALDEERAAAEAVALETAADVSDEDQIFEERWAAALVDRALARLRAALAADGKAPWFEELMPFLTGIGPPLDQEETAARLGMPHATFRTHLRRLRGRYRDALRAEVACTISSSRPDDIDEELRHLGRVLIAGVGRS